MKFPVIYKQLKLLIKIWEKSNVEDKDIMIKMMKDTMRQIEKDMNYED